MKVLGWVIIALVGLFLLLIVGIVAGQVGGIAIRRQGLEQTALPLRVSEPVVRGVPAAVRWEAADWPVGVVGITFDWRDSNQDYRLGEATVAQGVTSLLFPCAATEGPGSLLVRSLADGKLITSQTIALAAAGPECVQ